MAFRALISRVLRHRLAPAYRACICLLLCAALGRPPAAAAQAAPATNHLHGTVLDRKTGKPVARVLITTSDHRIATLTDNDGHFTLDFKSNPFFSAPAGAASELSVEASRPGYFPTWHQLSVPHDGTPLADLNLPLTPLASISGRVSVPDWDQPEHVPVMLLQAQLRGGHSRWVQVNNTLTDSHGTFRFTGLTSGEYILLTTQWRESADSSTSTRVPVDGYPPVYNGDAASLETALHIHLGSGDAEQTELHLHSTRFYPVVLPIAAPPGGSVQAVFLGPHAFSGYSLRYNPDHGTMETALPPGTYRLLFQSFRPDDPHLAFTERELEVGRAPLQTGPITLASAISIPVRITETGDRRHNDASPRVVNIELIPDTPGVPPMSASVGRDTEMRLTNVAPGRYWVHARGSLGYIAALTAGGVDLSQQSLVVSPDGAAPTIDVTLADTTGTLLGNVSSSNGTAIPANTTVYLVSGTGSLNETFRTQPVRPDGTVSFDGLIPDTYRLFAISADSGSAFSDLMQHNLLPSVPVVTVRPGEQTTIEVPFFTSTPIDDSVSGQAP